MAENDVKTKLRDYIRFCVDSVSGCCMFSHYLKYLAASFLFCDTYAHHSNNACTVTPLLTVGTRAFKRLNDKESFKHLRN